MSYQSFKEIAYYSLHWFCQTQENTIPMSRKVMFSLLLLNGLSEKVKRIIWLFNVVQDKK